MATTRRAESYAPPRSAPWGPDLRPSGGATSLATDGLLRDGDGLLLLDAAACASRLAAHPTRVGRLAFLQDGYPIVLPVNYVLLDGAVVFRTGLGSKLGIAISGVPVSFQVDDVDAQWLEGWSVLIKGRVEELAGAELQRVALRRLRPWSPGSKPRHLRVRAESMTGRQIV